MDSLELSEEDIKILYHQKAEKIKDGTQIVLAFLCDPEKRKETYNYLKVIPWFSKYLVDNFTTIKIAWKENMWTCILTENLSSWDNICISTNDLNEDSFNWRWRQLNGYEDDTKFANIVKKMYEDTLTKASDVKNEIWKLDNILRENGISIGSDSLFFQFNTKTQSAPHMYLWDHENIFYDATPFSINKIEGSHIPENNNRQIRCAIWMMLEKILMNYLPEKDWREGDKIYKEFWPY